MASDTASPSPRFGKVEYDFFGKPILFPKARLLRDLFRRVRPYTYDPKTLKTTHGIPGSIEPGSGNRISAYMIGSGHGLLPDHFSLAVSPSKFLLDSLKGWVVNVPYEEMHWEFIEVEDGSVRVFLSHGQILGTKKLMEIPGEETMPILDEVGKVLRRAKEKS